MTTLALRHQSHFSASTMQYAAVLALAAGAIVAGYALFRGHADESAGTVPSVWIVASFSFGLSSAFHLMDGLARSRHLPAILSLAGVLALEAIAVATLAAWARRRGWTARDPLAAAAGAILTYGWVGLSRMIVGGHTALGVPTNVVDISGQVLLLAIVLALALAGARRLSFSL
jgi:hypothetical protein